ncbi:MAG: hypothetical protein ACOYMA_07405 [Bacteroidia bacterium]
MKNNLQIYCALVWWRSVLKLPITTIKIRDKFFIQIYKKANNFGNFYNLLIELWSNEKIEQKANYIHNNTVVSGFVEEQHHWHYSSTIVCIIIETFNVMVIFR